MELLDNVLVIGKYTRLEQKLEESGIGLDEFLDQPFMGQPLTKDQIMESLDDKLQTKLEKVPATYLSRFINHYSNLSSVLRDLGEYGVNYSYLSFEEYLKMEVDDKLLDDYSLLVICAGDETIKTVGMYQSSEGPPILAVRTDPENSRTALRSCDSQELSDLLEKIRDSEHKLRPHYRLTAKISTSEILIPEKPLDQFYIGREMREETSWVSVILDNKELRYGGTSGLIVSPIQGIGSWAEKAVHNSIDFHLKLRLHNHAEEDADNYLCFVVTEYDRSLLPWKNLPQYKICKEMKVRVPRELKIIPTLGPSYTVSDSVIEISMAEPVYFVQSN